MLRKQEEEAIAERKRKGILSGREIFAQVCLLPGLHVAQEVLSPFLVVLLPVCHGHCLVACLRLNHLLWHLCSCREVRRGAG